MPFASASIGRAKRVRSPAEEDLALVGLIDAGDAFDQRRLAGAVVAEERDDLAGIDVPAHVVDGDQAAEALGEIADGEDGSAMALTRSCRGR